MSQLDRLGLLENPFNNLEPHYFYADKDRMEILNLAEQLIDDSSDFQVILGEHGIGKSHFLMALTEQVDDNLRVVKTIDATRYDTNNLLQGILDVLGTKSLDENVDLMEVLETQLSEIKTFGYKPVLFIDNAQALSIDSIRFLIQLSQQKQDEQPYINIVLFGTTQITEFLQSQELKNYRDVIHLSTLKCFSKEDTSAYLNHKMLAAGFERETPFTPRIIDSIYKDSEGLAKNIDYFADKFLASSGKADNYIDAEETIAKSTIAESTIDEELSPESDNIIDLNSEDQVDDFEHLMNDELLESFDDVSDQRSDRVEEQLNRLTEQFDEIDQVSSQDVPFVKKNLTDKHTAQAQFDNDNDLAESGLPKFVIPMALVGLIVVALIVVNSVFEQSESTSEQVEQEISDILSLELPPEETLLKEKMNKNTQTVKTEESATLIDLIDITDGIADKKDHSEPILLVDENVEESAEENISANIAETELPIVPIVDPVDNNQDINNIPELGTEATPEIADATIALPVVQLKSVGPETIIGSNHLQTITITGVNLEQNTHLIVSWPGGKKEFSQVQTPQQWQYINNNKIKLQLNTGITPQQWQVSAINKNSRSSTISFEVVKPYIATLSIKDISPLPLVGSDKQQTITIKGEGFSKQSVIELRWDKNKKHFSSRLTPEQFEFISSTEIKLSIITGFEQRKWMVRAISPAGKSSTSSFIVTKKAVPLSPDNVINDESWLVQQADNDYTIQLVGSYNKPAIDQLIKKYKLKGDVLVYKTLRDGKQWYTITYGSYASSQQAKAVAATFDPKLTKTPWVRTFASIKKLLPATQSTTAIAKTVEPVVNETVQVDSVTTDTATTDTIIIEDRTAAPEQQPSSATKDELWIRRQKPAHYTLQLFALSSEQNVKNYIKKHSIESQVAYFETLRNGKTLYVLVYGNYKDKSLANQAAGQLAKTLKQAKPWVRQFSVIQSMMIP